MNREQEILALAQRMLNHEIDDYEYWADKYRQLNKCDPGSHAFIQASTHKYCVEILRWIVYKSVEMIEKDLKGEENEN